MVTKKWFRVSTNYPWSQFFYSSSQIEKNSIPLSVILSACTFYFSLLFLGGLFLYFPSLLKKQCFFIKTIHETMIRVNKNLSGRAEGKSQSSFTYPPPAGEKRPPYPALSSLSLYTSLTQTSCAGTRWPREVCSIAPHLVLPSPQTWSTCERAEKTRRR